MGENIDYQELKAMTDRTKVRNYQQFEYREKTFNIFTFRHTRQDEKEGLNPVFWQNNSSLGDYDIYIATNVVRKEFRRPVVLHETLEAFLQDRFCEEFDNDTATDMAHEIAQGYEDKYARETLSDDLFQEYLQLRERLTRFYGR